ncbi:hypothetical protein IGS59_27545 [Janthinobacterium sp. GW460P]|uniref:hypothetical protein n=1 Tax=unclassified Janthinobacterium TaxID=2610881 RepID=UPI00111C4CB2|nr:MULTISPECIES: hypothetical protein [unclassified Janthinobacterium]MCC7706006.1 hypothetical protein [Janthinobacterium sp. GW460P]MCC7711508.1 hypothetical protein [Janthinobacterium sp. GW460W]
MEVENHLARLDINKRMAWSNGAMAVSGSYCSRSDSELWSIRSPSGSTIQWFTIITLHNGPLAQKTLIQTLKERQEKEAETIREARL